MSKQKDFTGKRFDQLKVLKAVRWYGRKCWLCRCDCGKEIVVRRHRLVQGRCSPSHGHTWRKETKTYGTPTYIAWKSMKRRCRDTKHKYWHVYGGKGIKVCKRWENSFTNFLKDMGERPPNKTSLGRIDGDKGYYPGNCEWQDDKEQGAEIRARNKKKIYRRKKSKI